MTVQEYADRHGMHLALAYLHLRVGQVPGAAKSGGKWVIPADAPDSRKFVIGRRDAK